MMVGPHFSAGRAVLFGAAGGSLPPREIGRIFERFLHFLGVSAPLFRQDQLWLAGPGSYSLVRLPHGTISSRVSLSGDYQGVNQSSFRKVVLLRQLLLSS